MWARDRAREGAALTVLVQSAQSALEKTGDNIATDSGLVALSDTVSQPERRETEAHHP